MKKIIILLITMLLVLTSCSNNKNLSKENGNIIITDVSENEITLEKPLEKVLLQASGSGGAFLTMMALDKDNFISKIKALDTSLENNREDLYLRIEKKFPEIKDIKRVNDFKKNDFSVENIISLGVDGIIVPISYKSQLDSIKDKLNIPIIYIDYHKEDLETHKKSTEIIAKATGLTKNLEKLNNFYDEKIRNILDTTKNLKDKKTVYVEVGSDGPDTLANSYGKEIMWGKIIEDVGGDNIAKYVLKDDEANPLTKEYILSKNPDIIIFTGSAWKNKKEALHMGFDIKKQDVKKDIERFLKRPGYNELNAVKNKEVYALNHACVRDMTDFYSYECLAKIFHNETFKDLDPNKDMKEFYKEFFPIEFEGTWFYKYE